MDLSRNGGPRRRTTLSIYDPQIRLLLAELPIDEADLDEVCRFGSRLLAAARLWLARGGLANRGRISKRDAHQMFALAFKGVGRG